LLYLPGIYALWFRNSLEEIGVGEDTDFALQHDQVQPAFPVVEAATGAAIRRQRNLEDGIIFERSDNI
jgi:hypothetical protein